MRRLDEGIYGCCEVCGAEIGETVLSRDPVATRCPAHAGSATTGEATADPATAEPATAGPADGSEGTVAVLARDDPFAFGREDTER